MESQPSPYYRRVGFRITRFEACAAFTHVAARMFAEPPKAALLFGVLRTRSLPPSPAPTATGWSDSCRAGVAPAEEWRLSTAHGKVGLTIEPVWSSVNWLLLMAPFLGSGSYPLRIQLDRKSPDRPLQYGISSQFVPHQAFRPFLQLHVQPLCSQMQLPEISLVRDGA